MKTKEGESLLGLRILVVDDEEIIREILCEVLESEGFVAQAVESADLALEFLHRESSTVALVLTDINMPGNIDGAELVKVSSRIWPSIPIVVMSGVATLQSAGIGNAAWFVRKPFAVDDMVACLRNALGCPVPSIA